MTKKPPKDNPDTRVSAVRTASCPGRGEDHVTSVKTADGSDLMAALVMDLMDAGRRFFVSGLPPGAPAYEVQVITGLPLLIQTRMCPACGERILFA